MLRGQGGGVGRRGGARRRIVLVLQYPSRMQRRRILRRCRRRLERLVAHARLRSPPPPRAHPSLAVPLDTGTPFAATVCSQPVCNPRWQTGGRQHTPGAAGRRHARRNGRWSWAGGSPAGAAGRARRGPRRSHSASALRPPRCARTSARRSARRTLRSRLCRSPPCCRAPEQRPARALNRRRARWGRWLGALWGGDALARGAGLSAGWGGVEGPKRGLRHLRLGVLLQRRVHLVRGEGRGVST